MRVSSALGTSRGEADRMRIEQEESERARQKIAMDLLDLTRVPSDRHVRLAESLALQVDQIEEDEGPSNESPTFPSKPELQQPAQEAVTVEVQGAAPIKMKDKPARGEGTATKTKETAKADGVKVEGRTAKGRDSKVESKANAQAKRPAAIAVSRQTGPAVSSATTKRSAGMSPSKAGGTHASVQRSTSVGTPPSGPSSSSSNHRDRAPQRTRETRPSVRQPVTLESSQDRVKNESSRLSTARSNMSTSSR